MENTVFLYLNLTLHTFRRELQCHFSHGIFIKFIEITFRYMRRDIVFNLVDNAVTWKYSNIFGSLYSPLSIIFKMLTLTRALVNLYISFNLNKYQNDYILHTLTGFLNLHFKSHFFIVWFFLNISSDRFLFKS